jgi:hypothetical protein
MILASDGYNVIGRRRDYAGRHISESVSVKNSSRIASLGWEDLPYGVLLWCPRGAPCLELNDESLTNDSEVTSCHPS